MKRLSFFSPVLGLIVILSVSFPAKSYAAMSFCNRSSVPIEAALGYREEADDDTENWVSEGWWHIEPSQCARVYGQPLTQRFYFYYAHALAQSRQDTPMTQWSGKYIFCTDEKAFRVEGDGDCASRNYRSTGFQELDLGANVRDYTLDFKESATP